MPFLLKHKGDDEKSCTNAVPCVEPSEDPRMLS